MIGNDIIDRQASLQECNWRRKGWLEKVFVPSEQELIRCAEDANAMVWLLWSMKEAAYKVDFKRNKKALLAPHQLLCSEVLLQAGRASGIVHCGTITCCTDSSIQQDFIHTIALPENAFCPYDLYIADTRQQTLQLPDGLQLQKDTDGIPYLENKNTGQLYESSKSHHGRFEAIVVQKTNPYEILDNRYTDKLYARNMGPAAKSC